MFSKEKMSIRLDGSKYIVVLVISVFFVVVANIALISDVICKYRLKDYLSNLSRLRFFSAAQRCMEIGTYFVFRYLFGINKCETENDTEITDEYEGWIGHVLSQTREAIEISEHNILSDIRTLESRLEQQGLLT